MGSTSYQFLGFALAVVLAYHLHHSAAWRKTVLLSANLLFLASFSQGPRSFLPMAAFLILGYAGVEAIRAFPKFAYLPILIATIGSFAWLKKYAFTPGSWQLQFPYVTIGMSYILFRLLHLMVDTHAGDIRERVPPLSYFNYTLSFTTLVSGPIQLYPQYTKMNAAAEGFRLNATTALSGVERIIRGLFKVNILALLASTWHTRSIEALGASAPLTARILEGAGVMASYPLFLYCNFSGYIDVVLGIAQLMGFILPENFNRPFASDSFIEFWSRWHMTLSNWLRMYVYNPLLLGLVRRFPAPLETVWVAIALFVTFFLVGVWHGQTSEFFFFGFLQGGGVAVNRVYQILMTRRLGGKRYRAIASNRYYVVLSRGLTFTWFTFTLVWFWSNWKQIGAIRLALGAPAEAAVWIVILACSTVFLAAWEALRARVLAVECESIPVVRSAYWRVAESTAEIVAVLALSLLMNQSAPEIVYKAF